MEDMTRDEFKTIMEMVRMIVEGSKDKEEALKKIDSLTILKDNEKNKSEQDLTEPKGGRACHRSPSN